MTTHIMLDLETMGTDPFSAILSIGAVAFDPNSAEIGQKFEINIDLRSAVMAGLRMDPSTVLWWMDKDRTEAREAWLAVEKFDLTLALNGFELWLNELGPIEDRRIWSNGANFDGVLLGHAYKATGSETPWAYNQEYCFRTIKGLPGAAACKPADIGIAHTALADALYQVMWMQNIVRDLKITI